MGNLLATAVLFTLSSCCPSADFLSWGWRVAFWLSAVIVLVGYYIRTKVQDAPIFLEARKEVEAEPQGLRRRPKFSAATRAASSPPWACASRRTSSTTLWSRSPSPT